MGSLKIGSLSLELLKPEKLDEQLLRTTGCSAREVREHLSYAAIAGYIASALLPFVKDAPSPMALTQAIVEDGVLSARMKVQELYDAELGIEPPPMPEHLQPERKRGRGK